MSPINLLNHYRLEKNSAQMESILPESTILYRTDKTVEETTWSKKLGIALILVALGGFIAATAPFLRLEANYFLLSTKDVIVQKLAVFFPKPKVTPPPVKPEFNPLVDPDGSPITPVNNDFSLIIPSIGVNAPIIAGVSPTSNAGYSEALLKGVAHASTSFYPDQNGTVYLFSHSTNYEWFVKDLNAVFYLLKNVKPGEYVVIMYLNNRYTYKIRESQIVSKKAVAFLNPQAGSRNLILQTCWPPGTSDKRMLIFADLVEEKINGKFSDI